MCKKSQILFSRKNKKNIISLSSAEFAHSILSDKGNFHYSGMLTGTQVLGRMTVSEIKKCNLFNPLLAEWARLMFGVLKHNYINTLDLSFKTNLSCFFIFLKYAILTLNIATA